LAQKNDVMKLRSMKQNKERLTREYDTVQYSIFHYKEYVHSCNGKCLTPGELITRRNELFEEISKLTRQIRKQGG